MYFLITIKICLVGQRNSNSIIFQFLKTTQIPCKIFKIWKISFTKHLKINLI